MIIDFIKNNLIEDVLWQVWNKTARGGGGGGCNFSFVDWFLGFMLGMAVDYADRAYVKDRSKVFTNPALSTSDVIQGITSLSLTLYTGFGKKKSIATGIPLGAFYAQLYCKVIAPKIGFPRYIIAKDATPSFAV